MFWKLIATNLFAQITIEGAEKKVQQTQIQTQTETQTQIENIEHFSNEMFDIKDDSITNNQHL